MSLMAEEIAEIPQAVARLLADPAPVRAAAAAARAADPALIATVARGSSDHACTFLKYAAELVLGLPVASIGPSVASVYGARLRLGRALCLAVSQSGQSPDILAMAASARAAGALTVAVTNDAASPLAQAVAYPLALRAGVERSVAATKTFVASAVAGLWLIAEWARDDGLLAAIAALPAHLDAARTADWGRLAAALAGEPSLYVLGRGPGYAIASEAALKFKEVAGLHAEAYSSAEVLHGPVAIVGEGFPVLALAVGDAAEPGLAATAEAIAAKGAHVFLTGAGAGTTALPHVRTGHPLTDPLALVVSVYAMAEALARARGHDPDRPRNLHKVTKTT
jgi:glucosamine--fructose-6-phosphate aminotransferase (isomerizing)